MAQNDVLNAIVVTAENTLQSVRNAKTEQLMVLELTSCIGGIISICGGALLMDKKEQTK